ncbi:hypothetical protein LTR53_001626 [Teratosphaeriaceae sp. CCFEE 6253]|nr:hypothetical protein LTR53_001626 [Teratosphaeriaceae sp. CCFEE 6253]
MIWTASDDRKLLLVALGREISNKEYRLIAASFDEKPSAEEVMSRLLELREEQRRKLHQLDLPQPRVEINEVDGQDLVKGEDAA